MDGQDVEEGRGPEGIFREGLAAGRILLPHCRDCGRAHFFPRVLCPHCHGASLEWRPAAGRGEIYTSTVVRRRPESGGDYNVCMVALPEGVRLMSRVEGIAPDAVRIGMAVRLRAGTLDGAPAVLCEPDAEGL